VATPFPKGASGPDSPHHDESYCGDHDGSDHRNVVVGLDRGVRGRPAVTDPDELQSHFIIWKIINQRWIDKAPCNYILALFDTPAGLELELVSNSSSSPKLTLALEVFG
jgi:hypothetical protein